METRNESKRDGALSQTVRNIVPSGTIAINARVFEMAESGIDIINLSVGEPDFNTPDNIIKAC